MKNGSVNCEICKFLLRNQVPLEDTIEKSNVYLSKNKLRLCTGTLWGLSRSLRSEQPNLTCRCIDTTLDDMNQDRLEELFLEVWNEDGENQVAYREGRRYVVRFIATKLAFTDLAIPNTNRYALTLPASKTFNDLKFDSHPKHQLAGNEIELQGDKRNGFIL